MIGRFIPAYRTRPKRRVILSPRFYFFDVGIVNFLLKRGSIAPKNEAIGRAFEHLKCVTSMVAATLRMNFEMTKVYNQCDSSRGVMRKMALTHSLLAQYARQAEKAAQQAGSLLAPLLGQPKTVKTKRSAIDLVTELDKNSEQIIYRILMQACPGSDFLGEERGGNRNGSPLRWIVDPLDGTMNFVHGLPLFGVSIALEYQSRIVVGVTYDPIRREMFTAVKNRGAFLNGRRIHVSKTHRLSQSLLSSGFSAKFRTHAAPYLAWFEAFESRSHAVRRIGTTVLCLAYVACGRMEGFYEKDLWPWDIAAGMLLVEEAGGRVTNFKGQAPSLAQGQLVASNRHIHSAMLRVLQNALSS